MPRVGTVRFSLDKALSAGGGIGLALRRRVPDRTALAPAARWLLLISCGYLLGSLGRLAGVPSPHLVAGLLVGAGLALPGVVRDRLPRPVHRWVQALVGVMMGGYLDLSSLRSAAPAVLPLTLVTAATVVLSVLIAFRLARTGRIDRPTATLSMVPGAASAMTVVADELDVDIRIVGVAQYLRLGLVAVSTPFVGLALATQPTPGSGPGGASMFGDIGHLVAGTHQLAGLLALVALAILGTQLGERLSLPAAAVLGPLLLSAAVASVGAAQGFAPTGLLQDLVFTLIGLEVGLRFTRQSLRQLRGLAGPILGGSLAVIIGCGALAWLLAQLTDVSLMDSYLATTPGGIYLVIPVALALHGNVALVSTVQSLRLFVVILLAPPLVRWVLSRTKNDVEAASEPVPGSAPGEHPADSADRERVEVSRH